MGGFMYNHIETYMRDLLNESHTYKNCNDIEHGVAVELKD